MRLLGRVVLVSALAGALYAQEGPTTQQAPIDFDRLRQEIRQRIEDDSASLASLPPTEIADAVEFQLQDQQIVIRTALAQTQGKSRIELKSLGGFTTIHVQGKPQAGKQTSPRHFELNHHSFDTAGTISVQTTVFASVGYLQIARTIEGFGEDCIVQFIQSRTPEAEISPADEGARLYVQVLDKITETEKVDLNLSAANIVELRRRYPRETSLYLQPILRDFGQDAAIFAVDARAAWQVFAPSVNRSDPELLEAIKGIVAEFNADDFHAREAAQAKLEALGQPAAVALMQFDRSRLNDEQNSRVDTFLTPYRPLSDEEAARLRGSAAFMLDCLISDDEQIRRMGLEALRRIADRPIEIDLSAPPPRRSAAVARLRLELLPASTQPQ